MGCFGGSEVDIEADLALLQMEPDHSALGEKAIGIPDRENWQAMQGAEQFGLPAAFVSAYEEDPTVLGVLRLIKKAHVHRPASYLFSLQRALKFLPVRFVVEETNVEGFASGARLVGGPIDKLCEVEDECSLDFVLISGNLGIGRPHLLRRDRNDAEEHNPSQSSADPHGKRFLKRVVSYPMHGEPSIKRTM
jgi:hypothetical protein